MNSRKCTDKSQVYRSFNFGKSTAPSKNNGGVKSSVIKGGDLRVRGGKK